MSWPLANTIQGTFLPKFFQRISIFIHLPAMAEILPQIIPFRFFPSSHASQRSL